MKSRIDATAFGSITVNGTVFVHDVIIRPDGRVKKRKKKLSKAVYGTSHTISRQEARYLYQQAASADRLIVGSGQDGNVELSPEAAAYLKDRKCRRGAAANTQGDQRLEPDEGYGGGPVPRHLLSASTECAAPERRCHGEVVAGHDQGCAQAAVFSG
jgi:hypothetical protein